mgnify:CR=1 FL=1
MKINNLKKVFMALALSVTLASCTNNQEPTASADSQNTDNQNSTEAVDMIDEASNETKEEQTVEEVVEEANDNSQASENENTTIDVKKEETTDNSETDDSSSEEASEVSEPTDDGLTYQERNGSYVSTLIASKNGARDEATSIATLSDLQILDGVLKVNGSFDYRENPENYDNFEELANAEYNFRIDENTEFSSGGGMAEPTYYTLEEFKEFYNEVKESGLGLIIEVENGIAKSVVVSS